jgi:diguanylate cyclase (GGDEF)-like protein
MVMKYSKKAKYGLAITAAVFLAGAGTTLQTSQLIGLLSSGANEAEHTLNIKLVQSAFTALKHQMDKTVVDNSYWDDAARNIYPTPNPAWMQNNLGDATGIPDYLYDTVVIIDGKTRSPLAAYRLGKAITYDLTASYSSGLETFFKSMPKDPHSSGSAAGFVQTPFGYAVAGLAPYVGYDKALNTQTGAPNYLFLMKHLSPELVASLGEQYLVDGLSLAPLQGIENKTGFVMKGATDAPLFAATWSEKHQGDVIATSVWPTAAASLALLLAVLSGMAAACWNLLRKTLQAEEKALHDANHDALTGLPNRKLLERHIHGLHSSNRHRLSIAFMDLDGFKEVNDSFGHNYGDLVLQHVARLIQNLATESNLQCRLGGDEFVVLFEGESAEMKARVFGESFIEAVGQPVEFDGRISAFGASIGIASTDQADINAEELLRRADVAMYRCKAMGKNQILHYRDYFDSGRTETRDIIADLKVIIAHNSMDVAFQPIVEAATGKITCLEALARWPKAHARNVEPSRFIEVAETSGLIDALGLQMLRKVCLLARDWGTMAVAVNVSAIQLNNPRFAEQVFDVFDECGVNPGRFEFEITETVLIKNVDAARRVIDRLRRRGIRLALDDFGSGHAGINYLSQFAFDRVKIDRSITRRALHGAGHQALVQGVVLISRSLDATITAEGIESEEEAQLLRLAGCTELQGYYFFRPMSAESVTALLAKPKLKVETSAA